jgi:hypothetical protein
MPKCGQGCQRNSGFKSCLYHSLWAGAGGFTEAFAVKNCSETNRKSAIKPHFWSFAAIQASKEALAFSQLRRPHTYHRPRLANRFCFQFSSLLMVTLLSEKYLIWETLSGDITILRPFDAQSSPRNPLGPSLALIPVLVLKFPVFNGQLFISKSAKPRLKACKPLMWTV